MAVNRLALEQCFEQALQEIGLFLWGFELRPGHGRATLRIYIDAEQGVSIEDCARASRAISAHLMVEDLIQGSYHLEVSSPGIERRFFSLSHYHRYIGKSIRIELTQAVEGRKRFEGCLQAVEDQSIILVVKGQTMIFSYANIAKATNVSDLSQ